MANTSSDQENSPSQELRNQFAKAIETNQQDLVAQLLTNESLLSNADLRTVESRDHFTNGLPLFRTCQQNDEELAELLLLQGADPDAKAEYSSSPEFGMPLHLAATEHRNYRLANRLLDSGASPNSYPNCDQSTIERVFYDARESGMPDSVIPYCFAKYTCVDSLKPFMAQFVANDSLPAVVKLFARMVDLGGQLPFCSIVRDEQNTFDDLLVEIAKRNPNMDGTPHDHPNSNVFNNIFGAARWFGYPKLVERLMQTYPKKFCLQVSMDTISVAIASHNRDGNYEDYKRIIVMQLENLKAQGKLDSLRNHIEFQPFFKIATDFTWHRNYGYRAEIAAPECYSDLAELFLDWGFNGINYHDPKTGHTPLSAAVDRGHHPGILTYIKWLLKMGAKVTPSNSFNPIEIARNKGFDEIFTLLMK